MQCAVRAACTAPHSAGCSLELTGACLLSQTELHDLVLGDVLAGEITSLILFEGIQVDLGAQWDG